MDQNTKPGHKTKNYERELSKENIKQPTSSPSIVVLIPLKMEWLNILALDRLCKRGKRGVMLARYRAHACVNETLLFSKGIPSCACHHCLQNTVFIQRPAPKLHQTSSSEWYRQLIQLLLIPLKLFWVILMTVIYKRLWAVFSLVNCPACQDS